MHKLPADIARDFADLPRGIATLSEEDLAQTLPEPHPSWVAIIEKEWEKRYSTN